MAVDQTAEEKVIDLEEGQEDVKDEEREESEELEKEEQEEQEEFEVTEEEFVELEEALERSEREKQNYIDRSQRLQADFANYKKRVGKEKERLKANATKELLSELLPVLDNFERALLSSKDNQELSDFLEGMEMISRQLYDVLKKEGVEIIPTVGEEFDPKFHEAVMKVESDEHESGIITEELQKGYMFKEQILRPGMVKVAE
jgi:molecular chaperone GrpE